MNRRAIVLAAALAGCTPAGAATPTTTGPTTTRPTTTGPTTTGPRAFPHLVGQWNGSWDGTFPTTLVVNSVSPTSASVIYEWGVAPAWNIDIPGFERGTARFLGGKLVVFLTNGAVATYVMKPDGTLYGTYRFRGRLAHAILKQ